MFSFRLKQLTLILSSAMISLLITAPHSRILQSTFAVLSIVLAFMVFLSVLHCRFCLREQSLFTLGTLFLFSGLIRMSQFFISGFSDFSLSGTDLLWEVRLIENSMIPLSLLLVKKRVRSAVLGVMIFLIPFFSLVYGLRAAPWFNRFFPALNILMLLSALKLLQLRAPNLNPSTFRALLSALIFYAFSEIFLISGLHTGSALLRLGAGWHVYKSVMGSVFISYQLSLSEEFLKNKQLECEARKVAQKSAIEQKILRESLAEILTEKQPEKLYMLILNKAVSFLNGSGGELAIYNKKSGNLKIEFAYKSGVGRIGKTIPVGEELLGSVAKKRKPLRMHNHGIGEGRLPQYPLLNWSGVIVVPLEVDGKLVGVLSVIESNSLREFTTEELELLSVFGKHAAVVIRNALTFEKIRHRAETDSLTGLYNHGHFFAIAGREVSRAQRYNHALSVVIFDIDFFKQVNDNYGHPTGDRIILLIRDLCRQLFRSIDMVGRYGGEEFIALLPETSMEEAQEVAERLRSAVEHAFIELNNGEKLGVTVSLGVSALDNHCTSAKELIERADEALYTAKMNGRNRFYSWHEQLSSNLKKARLLKSPVKNS
ncbi:hypothetical protein CHISP_3490 [Chitinispirillum alkaliphilum]|nr:hypothetical protein CHISP_3490 [Chitinispirillum alkaliphilum]